MNVVSSGGGVEWDSLPLGQPMQGLSLRNPDPTYVLLALPTLHYTQERTCGFLGISVSPSVCLSPEQV